MKFYNIGLTDELDVIGFYPQTERAEGYSIDSVNNISPLFFPDYEPKYGLKINSKSKSTDVLDSNNLNFGFVVSQKLKSLLANFNLPPHRYYRIDVIGTDIIYYWFHYITETEKYLEYTKTELEIYINRAPFKVDEIKIFGSQKEIMDFKKTLPYNKAMRFKSIQLNKEFPNYDLFEITGAQYFTLISEKLKEEIIKQNITGLEIVEYNKIAVVL